MNINIYKEDCVGCPMIWLCYLPDGSEGYLRYRYGIISLKKITERAGIFQEAIISEQIGEEFDGFLELKSAIDWLIKNGYSVTNSIA